MTLTTLSAVIGVGPVGDVDRSGELEQRGEALGVDRHHAVDLRESRLRGEAHQHLGDAREVGGEVDVLQRACPAGTARSGGGSRAGASQVRSGRSRDRLVPHVGAEDVADVELAVLGGDQRVAADEAAGGARLGVVLDDEQVGCGRRRRRRSRGASLAAAAACSASRSARASCSYDLVDRVAHRLGEVGVVAQRRRAGHRASSSAAAPSASFGVISAHLFEREAAVDDLERLGVDGDGERLAGVGEIGADVGEGAGGAHVRREERHAEAGGDRGGDPSLSRRQRTRARPVGTRPAPVMVSPSRAAVSARRGRLAPVLHEVDGVLGGERERRHRHDQPATSTTATPTHAHAGRPRAWFALELRARPASMPTTSSTTTVATARQPEREHRRAR